MEDINSMFCVQSILDRNAVVFSLERMCSLEIKSAATHDLMHRGMLIYLALLSSGWKIGLTCECGPIVEEMASFESIVHIFQGFPHTERIYGRFSG